MLAQAKILLEMYYLLDAADELRLFPLLTMRIVFSLNKHNRNAELTIISGKYCLYKNTCTMVSNVSSIRNNLLVLTKFSHPV